ncbi:DUF2214 family protein [Reichenbachiella ulvae]|uniref:DUF2214 family protein n=1 Tax=Reichenbachiella ulvae TaxID=2980104 RepID=A0ABT3CV29_9BACT|nr:DUF2214 family protein [Reichenbachiella ulvae]MCV9387552.1 DUF2214 family protein [Reichenbachiella ulvae]
MLPHTIFAFIHFVAAFGIMIGLVYERVTLSQTLSIQDAKRIQKADLIYGLSALAVLIAGFIRIYFYEKGSEFYLASPFFYVKMGAFTVVGVLSIYPTVRFLKWNKQIKNGEEPIITAQQFSTIKLLLNLEIVGVLIMLFAASAMARGIGM